ncbi:MAG: hypothetical protein H0U66_10555 [Gemmatimonadaceae bacterium]|nr:hypothetical protein [Gemmatimonadaceae bacterium]
MRTSRLAALIAVGICIGCSDASAPTPTFSGTYQLSTVNGQPLPVTFGDSTLTLIRWVGGSVTALPQSHFSRRLIQQFVENGDVQQTDTGFLSISQSFYRVHGATVQFYLSRSVDAHVRSRCLRVCGAAAESRTTCGASIPHVLPATISADEE